MKPNKEGVTNSFVLQQNLGTHLHRKPSNYIFVAWKETSFLCVCEPAETWIAYFLLTQSFSTHITAIPVFEGCRPLVTVAIL